MPVFKKTSYPGAVLYATERGLRVKTTPAALTHIYVTTGIIPANGVRR